MTATGMFTEQLEQFAKEVELRVMAMVEELYSRELKELRARIRYLEREVLGLPRAVALEIKE